MAAVYGWSARYRPRVEADMKKGKPVEPPSRGEAVVDDDWAKSMGAELPAEEEPEVVSSPPRRERQPRLPFSETERSPPEQETTRISQRPFTMQLRNEPLRPSLRQQVMNDDESHSVEFLKRALERALRERDAAIVMYEMRVREDGH
jgi:hypothetical protein